MVYLLLGLLPQLMGVAPEKAIKLTTNFTEGDCAFSRYMRIFISTHFHDIILLPDSPH